MGRKRFSIIILFLIISLTRIAFAAEIEIKAQVDKTDVTTDDDIVYKVIISSQTLKSLPEPEFPDFKNFDVLSSAQTSQISLGQGEIKSLLIYVFIIRAKRTGEFNIGPSKIIVNNKEYFSEKFQIEVRQGSRQLSPEPEIPKEEKMQSEPERVIL